MEEICTNLSATLCEAGIGGYKIFYEEELFDCLPENMRNRETLEAALKNLNGGGYIDVKYARGNTFCIACFKRYEAEKKEESPDVLTAETPRPCLSKKTYAALSLCAFLGGAAGGCIAAVLGAVL
ncbi:MAG: hypothetical protein NC131_00120 [Roseburia sp.]|nr:hypothetical protein [Roseburia sp.]